jgi:hypothetical protein
MKPVGWPDATGVTEKEYSMSSLVQLEAELSVKSET